MFRLANLVKLYENRLVQLGLQDTNVNSTHLKKRVLMHMPHFNAYNKGRDVFLAHYEDVGKVMQRSYAYDGDEMGVMMSEIVSSIREDIFSSNCKFEGSFDPQCQINSIPQSLLSVVNMLLNGSNIAQQNHNENISQPVLTIAQLIQFNAIKRRRDNSKVPKVHHRVEREPPVALYTGIKLHASTQNVSLIQTFYELGLCLSYDRIMM